MTMCQSAFTLHRPSAHTDQVARSARRGRQRGFTLFETIIVLSILALVATGLMSMQSKLWANQTVGRDQSGGQALISGCTERLLAVRRNAGYTSVTNALCNNMGPTGGFSANPTVVLKDAAGATINNCTSATATCTATISISNSAGTVAIRPLTLQLSNY